MQRLILDFLVRWRWRLGIFAALTVFATYWGIAVPCGQVVVIYLLIDARSGVFRAIAALPLTRRERMRAWWLLSVVVVPLLWLLPAGVGVILHQMRPPPGTTPPENPGPAYYMEHFRALNGFVPWRREIFATAVQGWVGFGLSATLFLLAALQPAQSAVGFIRDLGRKTVHALWALSVPGLMIVVPFLPERRAEIELWHWGVFAAVPVIVALSHFGSTKLSRRLVMMSAGPHQLPPISSRCGKISRGTGGRIRGLSGMPLFLAAFSYRSALLLIGTIILLIMLSVAPDIFKLVLVLRGGDAQQASPVEVFPFFFGLLPVLINLLPIAFAGLSGERLDLRVLRTLPIPTWRVVALLVAAPIAVSLTGAVFVSLFLGFHEFSSGGIFGGFSMEALLLCGFGTLTLAIALRVSPRSRFILVIVLALASAIGNMLLYITGDQFVDWLFPSGVALFAFSIFLLIRGLRYSTAFYRPRKAVGFGHVASLR